MHRLLLTVYSIIVIGCDDDHDSNASNGAQACDKAGDVSVALNCPGLTSRDAVVEQCKQEQASSPARCGTQLEAANACALKQPATAFECSDAGDGTNALAEGACESEQSAYYACFFGG